MKSKICSACETEFDITEFSSRSTTKDGLSYICKSCHAASRARSVENRKNKTRERYQTDPEFRAKRAEYFKQYRAKNYKKERARVSADQIRLKYGITMADYERMAEEQGHTCAICNKPEMSGRKKRLSVDHDHVTGKVRGLLCEECNWGIGKFKDDPDTVKAALDYLLKHKP